MSQDNVALSAEREASRKPYGLRLVSEKEEGSRIDRLPEGVYGFTNSPSSAELPLFRRPMHGCFEVQKRPGNAVVLLGYVTNEQKAGLWKGKEALSLDLYPDPFDKSSHLVEVPLARIDRRRGPSRDQGNALRLEISPA